MEKVLEYLIDRYNPESVILYGSYADGSNNQSSDFDALLITEHADHSRDVSVVNGIRLDVFIYGLEEDFQCENLPQLYDCRIILDKHGKAEQLYNRVRKYIDGFPGKTKDEIEVNLTWCEKMLLRTGREDAEGYYRWHWVLCDSLEFYCDICGKFYFGPKKTLRWMEKEDPAAFRIYSEALSCFEQDKLAKWIQYLRIINTSMDHHAVREG